MRFTTTKTLALATKSRAGSLKVARSVRASADGSGRAARRQRPSEISSCN